MNNLKGTVSFLWYVTVELVGTMLEMWAEEQHVQYGKKPSCM